MNEKLESFERGLFEKLEGVLAGIDTPLEKRQGASVNRQGYNLSSAAGTPLKAQNHNRAIIDHARSPSASGLVFLECSQEC